MCEGFTLDINLLLAGSLTVFFVHGCETMNTNESIAAAGFRDYKNEPPSPGSAEEMYGYAYDDSAADPLKKSIIGGSPPTAVTALRNPYGYGEDNDNDNESDSDDDSHGGGGYGYCAPSTLGGDQRGYVNSASAEEEYGYSDSKNTNEQGGKSPIEDYGYGDDPKTKAGAASLSVTVNPRPRIRRRNSCLIHKDQNPLAVSDFMLGAPARMSDRDMELEPTHDAIIAS
jgi:hypothetical protein